MRRCAFVRMTAAAWILVLALMASVACEFATIDGARRRERDRDRDRRDAIIRTMSDPPIACSLDPAALASRRAGLLAELLRESTSRIELPDGCRFTFAASSETLALVTRAIDAERQCCRFLTFHLTVTANLGEFVVELTGPAGTREFLSGLLDRDAPESA